MEGSSSKFFTGHAIDDDFSSMNANSTGGRWEEIMIAMGTKFLFILLWDGYKIFHGESPR